MISRSDLTDASLTSTGLKIKAVLFKVVGEGRCYFFNHRGLYRAGKQSHVVWGGGVADQKNHIGGTTAVYGEIYCIIQCKK